MKRRPQKSLIKKAVFYARVSSKEQEKEGFSIPAQLKLLQGYAESENLGVERDFVDVETAKQAGRTGFNQMVIFFQQNPDCRVLLVEKTDRLYRNLKDWVTIDELDLEIHFVKENVVLAPDSRSSEKFMHGIKVLMAKNYIDNLSEETKKGMLEKAEQGIYPSYAPLGYMNVDGPNGKRIIQPDPEVAPFVRKMFELYASGKYSLLQVTKEIRQEGLVSRKAGTLIQKGTVHKILTNPIYYGEFDWNGKRYKGIHDPILSKELFDRVQEMMTVKGRHRSRQKKHSWAFGGMLTCGHCGCALTAEKKKGRYIYYHCTGNRGKCPESYVREEEIARQFGDSLRAIRLDEDVLEWMVEALRESHEAEKQYHDEHIASLQKRYKTLQDRIDTMYIDKLDGRISEDFFDRKSAEWRKEQAEILKDIHKHQNANKSYLDQGVRLLELSQKAVILYEKQNMHEKRRLLDFVCSNSIWKDGRLIPNYRKPFDLLAVTNKKYQKKKTVSASQDGIFRTWLPGQDSNLQPSG